MQTDQLKGSLDAFQAVKTCKTKERLEEAAPLRSKNLRQRQRALRRDLRSEINSRSSVPKMCFFHLSTFSENAQKEKHGKMKDIWVFSPNGKTEYV